MAGKSGSRKAVTKKRVVKKIPVKAKAKVEAKAKATPKKGAPSKYKAEFNTQAYKLCLLGATDEELADFFEVHVDSIYEWKKVYKSFSEAIKRGKAVADGTVADKLFQRATGYEHKAVKIFNDNGTPLKVDYVEHYPPDTAAAIFWLKNRQKGKWRDKQDLEHTGANGSPLFPRRIGYGKPQE